MGIKAPLWLLPLVFLAACENNPRAPIIPVYDLKMTGSSTGAAVVAPGDTLANIANRYEITLEDIIRANAGNALKQGQRIALPPPRTYTVIEGDTLDRVARMFDTTPDALARANNIGVGQPLYQGQVLQIAGKQDSQPQPPTDHYTPPTQDKIETEQLAGQPRPTPKKTGVPRPPKLETEALKPKASAHAAGKGKFDMPVKGDIISGYGPKTGGLYNDGINIAAKAGTPVGAAQNGTVVFAGEGPDGYGTMVLIKHDEGYFTVYSHLSQAKTAAGAHVTRGEIVGRVGATGKVTNPQLHFEIREGTNALDPQKFL